MSEFLTRFRDLRARSSCDDEWTLGLLRTKLLGFGNNGRPVTTIGSSVAAAPFAAHDEAEALTGTRPTAEKLLQRLENSVNNSIRHAGLAGQHQHQYHGGQGKFNQWGGKGQQQIHLTSDFVICEYCNKKNHTADECFTKAQDILRTRDEKKGTKAARRGRGCAHPCGAR